MIGQSHRFDIDHRFICGHNTLKSVHIRGYSGPRFPHIQIRIIPNMDTFYALLTQHHCALFEVTW